MDSPGLSAFLAAEQIEGMLTEAVQDYFRTMLDISVTFVDAVAMTESDEDLVHRIGQVEEPMVVAAIGFCGEVDGVAYIYFNESVAQDFTSRFLGLDLEEIRQSPEVVNDALGELANMIVGSYKNKLCDLGFDCRLTVPSIVRGSAFSIETASEVVRHFICFRASEAPFAIDFIVRKPS